MKNNRVGSDFDDFLQEEGLLVKAEASAIKRILAFQIQKEMEVRPSCTAPAGEQLFLQLRRCGRELELRTHHDPRLFLSSQFL